MVSVIVERWSNADGSTDFLWSLWQDGRRIHMGVKHDSAEAAEQEARLYCQQALAVEPESVRIL